MLKFYKNVNHVAMQVEEDDMRELIKRFFKKFDKGQDASSIIAKIFCDNFGLIKQYADLFKDIEGSQKGSIALETIYNCLLKYDNTRNCTFITYFINSYQNELRREIRNRKYQKRKLSYEHNSIDKNIENSGEEKINIKENVSYDQNVTNVCYDDYEEIELKDEIDNSNLSDTEKNVCENIINYKTRVNKQGYKSDIAEMSGITSSWLSTVLNNLRNSEIFSNVT